MSGAGRKQPGDVPPPPATEGDDAQRPGSDSEGGSSEDETTQLVAGTQAPLPPQHNPLRAPAPTSPQKEDLPPERVTPDAIKQWSNRDNELVHMSQLRWDYDQQWGQIRPLNDTMVEHYFNQVQANPPRVPVSVLLRQTSNGVS